MKYRILFIFLILFFVWIGVLTRAAIIQVFPNQNLAKLEKNKFSRSVVLNARRGAIFDRNGRELAVTVPSYSLYADPKLIKNSRWLSRKLSKYFKGSSGRFYKKIKNKNKRFVWIKRRLSREKKKEISGWNVRGLAFIEEAKRVYPNGHTLSQLIGFVGSDDQGLEGLELEYEKYLKGKSKKVELQRDARGRPLLINGRMFTSQPDAQSLHLTIDYDLQYKLEQELSKALRKFKAESAVGVILNVEDSSILAMANWPNFNPNYGSLFSFKKKRNRSVTDAFEPGSTIKSFVVAGALAEEVYKPGDKINCEGGRFKINGKWITESSNKHRFNELSMSEVLMKSSNVGVAKIALALGDKRVRRILSNFGFGQKTGIDFPGESSGILQKLPWIGHLTSNISFGHGLTATPLQIASAYAVIANGGLLKRPYVVDSISSSRGKKIRLMKEGENVIRRVLTKEQAVTMRLMLLGATSLKGTGYNARVHGYPVAGKTGTAQKVKLRGRGYQKGSYISSFAGFIPVNKPKFVIYIAVDNPQEKYYGSEVAAPIFAKVASFSVLRSGLPPVLLSEKDIIDFDKNRSPAAQLSTSFLKKGRLPNLKGMTLREAVRSVKNEDLRIKAYGSGRVKLTWPKAGEKVTKGQVLKIRLQ